MIVPETVIGTIFPFGGHKDLGTAEIVTTGGVVQNGVGLLGRQALQGGMATYLLGVLLHFFIAFSATAIYYAASRRLVFLKEYPLVCGLFYGVRG